MIVFAAFTCLNASLVLGQSDPFRVSKDSTRNMIAITASCHEFFTALPIASDSWVVSDVLGHPSLGLEYSRNLIRDSRVLVSAKYYIGGFLHVVVEEPCTNAGQIDQRQMALFELAYQGKLLSYQGARIAGILGLNFRLGRELIVSCNPQFWEGDLRPLRDLGLVIGLSGIVPLGKRFEIGTALKYTEYVYRRGGYYNSWYSNFAKFGSTRHLLSLQFGLGYKF
jgi:hypothetical protein